MIVKIVEKEDFLNAIIYYPACDDEDWIDLKNKVSEYFKGIDCHHITVQNVAEYLLSKNNKKSELQKTIDKLFNNFILQEFQKEPIETCPTLGDNHGKLFLRGGNKRSIVYAMKLLNNDLDFETVMSSHVMYFTRLDNNNLAGLATTKSEILLKK